MLATLAVAAGPGARAERLPVRLYSTADGLAHDAVNRSVPDSRGFLWFCTDGGLSRFDGYGFTSYTTHDGLPHDQVLDVLEARDGGYWIATSGGLVRFDAEARPGRFEPVRLAEEEAANQIRCLLDAGDGGLWVGAVGGLFHLERDEGRWTSRPIDLREPAERLPFIQVNALLPDGAGGLWIGSRWGGIHHLAGDGRVTHFPIEWRAFSDNVRSLVRDPGGDLWVVSRGGVFRYRTETLPPGLALVEEITDPEGDPLLFASDLDVAEDGTVWIATQGGLIELSPALSGERRRPRAYKQEAGLAEIRLNDLARDRVGNAWIATESMGVVKLVRRGFRSWDAATEFRGAAITSLIETRTGELVASTANTSGELRLYGFDGARFVPHPVPLPQVPLGWGWGQWVLQDHGGEWWVPSAAGLFRFASADDLGQLERAAPAARYRAQDGLGHDEVFRLYEDSRGDLWISAGGIVRWERGTGRFFQEGRIAGSPTAWASAFAEDRSGTLWLGVYGGALWRRRGTGFEQLGESRGLPPGGVTSLHVDSSGGLWVGTSGGGVARIEHPEQERPRFAVYSTEQGLSDDVVECVTEDRQGRIYLGTTRGVERLDPATGNVVHYSIADGLLSNRVTMCRADRHGNLWFSGPRGLSRLAPEPDPDIGPPPVRIGRVRVAGVDQPVSPLGEEQVPELRLDPAQRQMEIEYFGLDYGPGVGLRYQVRLDGAETEWSPPSERRTVHYARLTPGRYRFEVRAIDSRGRTSPVPASVTFRLPPPLWRRAWFLLLVGGAAAGLAYGLYRYRIERLLEIERMRTRIATDLHDDIGSSLSQIAILSEVTRRGLDGERPDAAASLSRIAEVAGDVVDSLGDIVWAINPRRDRLDDLVQRMRWFAADLLEGAGIDFRLDAPGGDERLDADVRQQIYLVYKEALHNVLRHARCRRAGAELRRAGDRIVLRVWDDGAGLPAGGPASPGHGLESMRSRARSVGGRLAVEARAGGGVEVVLDAPLRRRGRRQRAAPPSI